MCFKNSDNFNKIIKKHFKDCNNIELIQTGWTNFVYKIISENEIYYFRFPRNKFFADAILKEERMLKFISDKVSIQVPNLKIFYHKKRPYSIHKSINGVSLSDCYLNLTEKQKTTLAKDIIKFINDMQSVNLDKYKHIKFQKVSCFLDELSKVSKNNYDLSQHLYLKNLEEQCICISHGDFNPGNLILYNGKLVGVIDFAFAGVSHHLIDISRLLGRVPSDFKKYMLSELQKERSEIDIITIEKLNNLWKYVEQQYIMYIKQKHPSIQLPTLI